jgi:hypothetical protein
MTGEWLGALYISISRTDPVLVLLGILGLEAGVLGFPLGFVHKVKVP